MMHRNLKIAGTIIATILFALLAYLFSDHFASFVYRQFEDIELYVLATDISGQFESIYIFVVSIAILPCLFLLSNVVLRDEKPWRNLVVIPLTILCGIILMSYHIHSMRLEILDHRISFTDFGIPVAKIRAGRYLGIGFLIGAMISTALVSFLTREQN